MIKKFICCAMLSAITVSTFAAIDIKPKTDVTTPTFAGCESDVLCNWVKADKIDVQNKDGLTILTTKFTYGQSYSKDGDIYWQHHSFPTVINCSHDQSKATLTVLSTVATHWKPLPIKAPDEPNSIHANADMIYLDYCFGEEDLAHADKYFTTRVKSGVTALVLSEQ